ncbi:MAG TPA: HAMP domain-containing sensor histidine kinase [Polyangia bacterium]|nr:HAMP domain-containing sensor histidine kinase [Polyangia bacterium]
MAFVLSTAISEYADVRIQRAAAQITRTTAPAVAGLATLRGELRWYELLADDVADRGIEGVPQPPSPELEHARAAIERAWAEYRALGLPHEGAPAPGAGAALKADLDAALDRFEGQAGRAEWSEARATLAKAVRPATEHFDEELMGMVERHAERGSALAQRIERLGRQSIVLAVGLDATSLLLAIFTALMVVRVERRYTELIERRAEELELFAGRVAHDVLGPLGAASLALDVAAAEAEPGGRTARLVGSGRAGLRRARTIADALLEFARAGAQPAPGDRADPAEVVRAVVDEVEPEAKLRGVAIEVDAAPGVSVACGAGMLTSIVANLVRNAVKYVGDGAGKRVVVRAKETVTLLRLEVEDDGPGLPAALGDNVFQPYVRGASTGKPGIGLGLATVKKITEAHGGRIEVRTAPGQGTRFRVELPLAPPVSGVMDVRVPDERANGDRPGQSAEPAESVDRPAQGS